jgi:hypothetical protein
VGGSCKATYQLRVKLGQARLAGIVENQHGVDHLVWARMQSRARSSEWSHGGEELGVKAPDT